MLKRLERWFTVLMLLFLSNGVIWIATGDSEASFVRTQGTLELHLMQAMLYAVLLAFILLHWKSFVAGLVSGRWVLVLSLVAVASVGWSTDPGATATHSLALLATTVFGIYLGARYDLREQVGLLVQAFSLIVLLSVGFALLLPQYGKDHYLHWGSWQGIFAQKNLLGKAMVVSVIVFLSVRGRIPGIVRWSAIAASIALIGLSRSKGALLLIPVFMGLALVYRLLRTKKTFSIPIAIGLAMGAATAISVALLDSRDLLLLLHRDSTLTGRTTLWEAVWSKASTHMVLGFGFDAFWNGLRGESANIIMTLGWAAKHSHNGFLDLLLDLGVVGLGLFLIGYFVALRQAIHLAGRSDRSESSWPLHYLAFMILYYLTEGQMVRQDSLYWALYVAVVVSVSMARVRSAERVEEILPDESMAALPAFAEASSWGSHHA